jgi:hypothetical protein
MKECAKILVILIVASLGLTAFGDEVISLSGTWQLALDYSDVGLQQGWYNRQITDDSIVLPASLAQRGKGAVNANYEYIGGLSDAYYFWGCAWYQRQINIPSNWANKRIVLTMERTKVSMVWVDSNLIGKQTSLAAPHNYDLTNYLTPGSHRITIRVDSRLPPTSDLPVQGGMQIAIQAWNGILGKFQLRATDRVWLDNVLVRPDVTNHQANLIIKIGNSTGGNAQGTISLAAQHPANAQYPQHSFTLKTINFSVGTGVTEINTTLLSDLNVILWDEFSPELYNLTVVLNEPDRGCNNTFDTAFGMREFKTSGTQFTINGRKTFLRGKHDCIPNPTLGYQSMDVNEWVRMMTLSKQYGINHYRFHTCVPPEAAFKAADIVGIYIQPELYNNGLDISQNPNTVIYSKAEGRQILNYFGNHPSFVMLGAGNELYGSRTPRAAIVSDLRNADPSRLYSQGSNNDFTSPIFAQGDDYWTTMRTGTTNSVRGSFAHMNPPLGHIQTGPANTLYDYSTCLMGISVPVVSHEIGEFEVSPNFDEIRKYTGVQKAWNLIVFQNRLIDAGMFDQWRDFFRASGALSILCYREEIEAALRTPGFGGFQILDLQDWPYGGTVITGIFDAFMKSKGLIDSSEWRQFCSETVPLLKFEKYTWKTNETFGAVALCANYGAGVLSSIQPTWKLKDSTGTIAAQGSFAVQNINIGLNSLGAINLNLSSLNAPQKYILSLELGNTGYKNEYSIWVYPSQINTDPGEIVICRQWDTNAQNLLRSGKKVLFVPQSGELTSLNSIEGFWPTDFGNWPSFNTTAPGTMGILCDPNHPVFASFPTEFYSNWQWFDLINNSRSVILDSTQQGYRPIVQVIDNFGRYHKLGLFFEGKVGSGKLFICGIDLLSLTNKPEANQLLHSILAYMKSESFSPAYSLVLDNDNFGVNGVIEEKMLAHWTFDSVMAGAFHDESENGHDAVINGTAVLSNGVFNSAADFASGNFYATAGTWSPEEGTDQFSISFWINYSGRLGTIISKDGDNIEGSFADTWRILVSQYGEIYFDEPEKWQPKTEEGVLKNDGKWQHVCAIETGSGRQIYVDGVKVLDVQGAFMGDYPSAEINIGSMYGGYWNAANKIDDLIIYNYALSPNQVQNLYLEGPGTYICTQPLPMDFDNNCKVDMSDLIIFSENWLVCNRDPQSMCK